MKQLMTVLMLNSAVAFAPNVAAADATKQGGKIVVEDKRVVELADGGTIAIDEKGRTYHVDAAGKRVRMKDGVVMTGKDGAKYIHKNDAIWKQITEKGTLSPNR